MNRKKILILTNDQLLSASIASLLIDKVNLDVLMLDDNSKEDFIEQIQQVRPDVIIMVENAEFTRTQTADFKKLQLLLDEPNKIRTIVVNAKDNSIRVCDRHLIQHLEDFLSIL